MKTSPSGMFISPAHETTGMPAIENLRSVSGPVMWTSLGGVHPGDQRLERLGQPGIIKRADVEIEILERLGAHAGLLGHARAGQTEHAPARLGDPALEVDRLLVEACCKGPSGPAGTSVSSLIFQAPRRPR